MTAKLLQPIPPQSFELVRARICEILATELANQQVLTPSFTAPTVWEERFYPLNSETDFPAVNVCYANGTYGNGNVKKVDGEYMFNVDVYTNASTTEEMKGDKAAMLRMSKIVGMIRAILMNPTYIRLGYEAPSFVIGRKVERIFIGDKSTVEDALSSVVGRIQVIVSALEDTELATERPLDLGLTNVYLKDSPYGFKWDIGTTITNEEDNTFTDQNDNNINIEY